MNLFENLQMMHSYDKVNSSKKIEENVNLNEGVMDIVSKIKNWFEQNKNNKLTKELQNKIEADGGDIEAFFKNLVPSSGKADTEAGELIRAMMRLLYRDYNDGDVYFSGYGIESCGDAASYLVDKHDLKQLIDFAENHKDVEIHDNPSFDKKYTNFLNELANDVIDIIRDNPNMLITPNEDDMLNWPSDNWKEYELKYDYEIEFNDAVQRHLDEGNIDINDLEYEISTWMYCDNVEQEWGSLTIKDLSHDEFEELTNNFWKWMEEYGNQLDEEFGSGEEDW